jgi:hypothetical protein
MLGVLESLRVDDAVSAWIVAETGRWYDEGAAKETQRVTVIRKRLEEVERLAAASYEEKLLGRITEEMWRAVSGRWKAEREGLQAELATIAPVVGRVELLRLARQPFELLETAAAQYVTQDAAEKGRLVKTCCSNFLVTEGSLSIHLRSPFDVMAKGSGRTDWLATLDDYRTAILGIAKGRAA